MVGGGEERRDLRFLVGEGAEGLFLAAKRSAFDMRASKAEDREVMLDKVPVKGSLAVAVEQVFFFYTKKNG